LPVSLTVLVVDGLGVELYFAELGGVEPADELRQSGLAAPVTADQKDEFARREREVDGAERETPVLQFPVIGVRHALQLKTLERGRVRAAGRLVRFGGRERKAERVDLVHRDVGAGDERREADDVAQGDEHVEEREGEARQCLRVHADDGRHDEDEQAEENEEDQLVPEARRRRVDDVADEVRAAVGGGGRMEDAVEEGVPPVPV
jgi:hypothetical protein